MAVGAFTYALLVEHTTWNLVPELLVVVAITAVSGLVIGIPATRLHGPYLAGMTLMVALGPALPDQPIQHRLRR